MKLSDITILLSRAAAAPQHAEMQEIVERLNFFFKREDSGNPDEVDGSTYTPVYVNFVIGEKTIKYPLLLLGTLTPVDTKRVAFKLGTDLDLEGGFDNKGQPELNVQLKKGLFKNASHLEIEGEFVGGKQPEAFHQLQDKYNNLIAKALQHANEELMEVLENEIEEDDKDGS